MKQLNDIFEKVLQLPADAIEVVADTASDVVSTAGMVAQKPGRTLQRIASKIEQGLR